MSAAFRPWSALIPPGRRPKQTLYVTTSDGARLAIHRVRPAAGGSGPPVMLLHGLGANAYGWLLPERSLATYLSERGFDCFVPELRGAGASQVAKGRWDLDDYLDLDLPAILSAIREESGSADLRFVGHSMGGLLMCCYVIRHGDAGIARGVGIGSALDYSAGDSGFRRLHAARALLSRFSQLPFGPLVHLLSPLLARVPTPLEAFNFHRQNVEPEVVRRIHAHAFESIPVSLLQSLGTTFEEGGLRSRDGRLRYLECAARCRFPLLLLAGSKDVQCPIAAVEATARQIGACAEVRAFGRAHGHGEDYGHFDLLVGRRAQWEVWPEIAGFLGRAAKGQEATG